MRRILVGISLGADVTPTLEITASDRHALENAIWLAEKAGASIELHHAIDWVGFDPLAAAPDLANAACEQASSALSALADEVRARGVDATHTVTVGPAAVELIARAEETGADLIVVGPRAHSTDLLGRLTYGSSAKRLARQAPCDLWVVAPDSGVGFSRAVILVDLTPSSLELVAFGNWVREQLGVETELLHCVDFPADIALQRLPDAQEAVRQYHKAVIDDAEKRIDELIGPERKGWRVSVIDDWVIRVAPKVADAHGADLLMLSSTSKEGFVGKLLGSTASKLLGKTTQSTYVYRLSGGEQ